MQEANKSMKEKGIKAEDVKNLPPIEVIHGLNTPPPPKPTPKKRGILYLSPEDVQQAKKSMKEKGIKVEDVKITSY